MKDGTSVTKDDVEKIKKALADLMENSVLVGIPAEDTERKEDEDSDVTNAAIGYIAEFGAPELNIPERPWLQPGIRDDKENISKYLRAASRKAVDGDESGIEAMLMSAGMSAQSSVKNKIRQGPFTQLSPVTIAARKRRGVTRVNPLIDTGQFLNAVTYVLRMKK